MIDSNLIVNDFWNSEKNWDINIIKAFFNNPNDVEDICKIYIPKCTGKD